TVLARTHRAAAAEPKTVEARGARGRLPQVAAGTITLALLLIAPAAFAQAPRADAGETVSLTLDEAVRRAVEKNPDLAIVRLGTDAGAARVGESRGAFTPVFSATAGRSGLATPAA